jgi:phosphoserine phosphatase RsbU/P
MDDRDADADAGDLYERAPFGYLSTAADGTIVKVNQTFVALTGYAPADLVGQRRFADLLTGGGRIYHETHYAPLLQMQGEVHGIALDIVCADGRRVPVLVNSVVHRRSDDEPVEIRVAVFDATERRSYERELLSAKRRAEESEVRAVVLARTLQQTLLPPTPPDIPGLDVAASYRPAFSGEDVGGDFYDVFQIAADDWFVVVGDVQGKGVDAAVVTTHARYAIRAAAVRRACPSDVLATLNEVLLRDDTDRFCTVALLRLQRRDETWRATVSCGGHPLPLLLRPGAAPRTLGRPGTLLGMYEAARLHDEEVALGRGDVILLYTDGVTEGRRGTDFYGEARLDAVANDHLESAAALTDAVVADVLAFQAGVPRDDLAVIAVRVP